MTLLKKNFMRHVNFLTDTGSHGLRLRKIVNYENGMLGEEIFLVSDKVIHVWNRFIKGSSLG